MFFVVYDVEITVEMPTQNRVETFQQSLCTEEPPRWKRNVYEAVNVGGSSHYCVRCHLALQKAPKIGTHNELKTQKGY